MKECPRCKNENLKEEYKYCPICGYNLKETAPEVPAQEQLVECGSCYKDNDYLAKKFV